MEEVRLIFAGGGTGGHLFPAIAIADRVKEKLGNENKVVIEFVGTRRGIEYRMQDKLGYRLHLLNIRGLRRSLTPGNLLVPFIALTALLKARALLGRFKPDVVVGTGGYVCWPVLRAASMLSIPIVLQEQNSFPGLTTRQLASRASRIFLGFEKGREFLKTEAEVTVSGNPVRANLDTGERSKALEQFGLDPSKKTILVLGGSQGARVMNNAVLQSLENDSLSEKYQLLWQCGKRDYKEVSISANKKAFGALFPFAEQMELVYAAADFAIARAGALTLAELEACRVPALLIPYPFATGDHQKKNAIEFENKGVARVIDEKEVAGLDVIAEAIRLMESDDYENMKRVFERSGPTGTRAVDVIADGIIDLIRQYRKAAGVN